MNVVTLNAQHNAYLDNTAQNTNFGQSGIKLHATDPIYTLIRFDYSTNTTSKLTGAKIRLYVVNNYYNATVSIYRVTGSWAEMTVTWNTRPTISATPCGTLALIADDSNRYYTADITELGDLKSTIGTNYGFLLKITSGGGAVDTDITGRTGTSGQVPHLDLYYEQRGDAAFLSDYGIV